MREKSSSLVDAARATLIGGVVFLIPGFIVFFVVNKVFNLLRSFAAALGSWLGVELPMGGALLNLAAIAAVLLICFLAGLLASRASAVFPPARRSAIMPEPATAASRKNVPSASATTRFLNG